MASNLTIVAPQEDFAGDEFANNLFSDLAPLLTLFGEQVTKQFLSLSMGPADNILLAMAPLGIITIVVSSIRVTKSRILKAIVGRARESRATAEAELLSSTSEEVCELFDGTQVVRILGEPETKEFVFRERKDEQGAMIWDLQEALLEGILRRETYRLSIPRLLRCLTCRSNPFSARPSPFPWTRTPEFDGEIKKTVSSLLRSAPNVILNAPGTVSSERELWSFACVGIFLQLAVLIFGALTTYHWEFQKGGAPIPAYGYPCTLAGIIAVSVGLLMCSHTIEGSTNELSFKLDVREEEQTTGILRIQRACSASEQHFGSYALFNSRNNRYLRLSRLGDRSFTVVAAIGCIISIAGFIVQFVGLRALHWSATIMQLGATVLMTGIRSYVRRGLTHDMESTPLPEGDELAWLTEFVSHTQGLELLTGAYLPPHGQPRLDPREFHSIPTSIISARLITLSTSRPERGLDEEPLDWSLPRESWRQEGSNTELETYHLTQETPLRAAIRDVYSGTYPLQDRWQEFQTPSGTSYQNHNTGIFRKDRPAFPDCIAQTSINSNSRTLEAIDQRLRLLEMTNWGDPYTEISDRLIAAMLQVRGIIENPKYATLTGPEAKTETSWALKTLLHIEPPTSADLSIQILFRNITIYLPYNNINGQDLHTFDKTQKQLDVILSMWLRSISKRSRLSSWYADPHAEAKTERSAERTTVEFGKYFLRIVATETCGDSQELNGFEFLGNWLDSNLIRIPTPDGSITFSCSEGFDGRRYTLRERSRFQLQHHPIFGLQFSSLLSGKKIDLGDYVFRYSREARTWEGIYQIHRPPWCEQRGPPEFAGSSLPLQRPVITNEDTDLLPRVGIADDQTVVNKTRFEEPRHSRTSILKDKDSLRDNENAILENNSPQIEAGQATTTSHRSIEDADPALVRRIIQPELAVYSQATLIQNCSMEIFSGFLWAATEHVQKILGTTEFSADIMKANDNMGNKDDTEPRIGTRPAAWRNDVVDMLATVLFDLRLVESVAEARNVVVPVLFARGLLPSTVSTE